MSPYAERSQKAGRSQLGKLARSAFDRALAPLRPLCAPLHGVEAELLGLALAELLLNGKDVARLVLPVLASSPSASGKIKGTVA